MNMIRTEVVDFSALCKVYEILTDVSYGKPYLRVILLVS